MSVNKPTRADESVSAYLDGELHGHELARIERLIDTNNEYRQLADDMRILRVQLKRLPRHRLAEDFSGVVLRQAEREMLKPADDDDSDDAPSGPPKPPGIADRGWWRGMVWATTAVAAALLLGLVLPRIQPDASVRDHNDSQVAKALGSKNILSEESGQRQSLSASKSSESSRENLVRDSARLSGEITPQGSAGEPSKSMVVEEAPTEFDDDLVLHAPVSADGASYAEKSASIRSKFGSKETPPVADEQDAIQKSAQAVPTRAEMVVTIEVPLDVFRRRRIDVSMANNDIHFGGHDDQKSRYMGDASAEFWKLHDVAGEQDSATASGSAPFEVIYVEATRAQINATLNELQQHPHEYTLVDVRSADTSTSKRSGRSGRVRSPSSGRREDSKADALKSLGYVGSPQTESLLATHKDEQKNANADGVVKHETVDEQKFTSGIESRSQFGKAKRIALDNVVSQEVGNRAFALRLQPAEEKVLLQRSIKNGSLDADVSHEVRSNEELHEEEQGSGRARHSMGFGSKLGSSEKRSGDVTTVLFVVRATPNHKAASRSAGSDQPTHGQ